MLAAGLTPGDVGAGARSAETGGVALGLHVERLGMLTFQVAYAAHHRSLLANKNRNV